MQQQKELGQNTAALELQADELKKSVKQHEELVKVTREQVQAELKALEIEQQRSNKESHPIFLIVDAGKFAINAGNVSCKITIRNTGPPAYDVMLSTKPELSQFKMRSKIIPFLASNSGTQVQWVVKNSGELPPKLKIIINCRDCNSKPYAKTFDMVLGDDTKYHLNATAELG